MPKPQVSVDSGISADLWAIVFGIIIALAGWFASPLGSGWQALLFIIGLILIIFGFMKYVNG